MHLTKLSYLTRLVVIAAFTFALTVTGCKSSPAPDDTAINTALQTKLASDNAIATEPIQTFVQNGIATLQGAVGSEAAKALAASDASQVPGVKSVVNQLTVQTAQQTQPLPPVPGTTPQPPSPPAPAAPGKPSAALQRPTSRPAPPAPPVAQYTPPSQPAPIERRSQQPDQQQPAPPATPAPPPPPAFRNVTVPSGTTLPIRITQSLSSATAQPGDSFSGTVASDVVIDGLVVIPVGTTVNGRVDEVHEAAHFKGSALLTLSLVTLNHRGEHTSINTEPYSQQGKGRGTNTAEKVGGGAAVGAILGGIFGGGKGAAIGAAAGGGLGAGAQGVTRGQQVQIASETLIRFRLSTPIELRASTARTSESDANLQPRNSN